MRTKLIGILGAFVLSAGMLQAASTVSSYSPPKLVDEINTALANPSSTTVTTPNIIANGTAAASLGVTYNSTATGTLATVSVKAVKAAAAMTDNDAVVLDLFNGNNDSSEKVSYGYITVTATDVTTNTEDSTIGFSAPVAGVNTDMITLGGAARVTAPALTVGKASVASGVITFAGTTSGTATMTVADDGSTVTVNKPVLAAVNGTVGERTPAAGVFTEATVDGKYAVVGGDASTAMMIQKGGSVSNGVTVTFPAVFGATPVVILGAQESTATVPYASSITVSNFVVNGEAGKVQSWVAVGTRP
jgi:hypothetical protein